MTTDYSKLISLIEMAEYNYMILFIYVDSNDEELKHKYIKYVDDRHNKMMENIHSIDAGFDLFTPTKQTCNNGVHKVDYQIICKASIWYQSNREKLENLQAVDSGFYMYPRSSLSKTNLRLANSVGIIDAGYRGHLIGMFDVKTDDVNINKYDRHLQICAPGLIPIVVKIVDSLEVLGVTSRGDGAFGSTGV